MKKLFLACFLILLLTVPRLLLAEATTDQINVNLTVTNSGSGGGSSGGVSQTAGEASEVESPGGGGGDDSNPPPPPSDDDGGDTTVESLIEELLRNDPFLLLPEASLEDIKLARLSLADFLFIQIGEPVKKVSAGNIVTVNGRKHLTIALDYDAVPEVLKTIGMSLLDIRQENRVLSFILRLDNERQAYTATLAPFESDGIFPFNIHLLDYSNHRVKTMSGFLRVVGTSPPVISRLAEFLEGLPVTPSTASAALLGASSVVLVAGGAKTALDLYLLLLRAIGALPRIFGFRRKLKPWGTVYDSVTKRPLDPAYVSVQKDGREMTSAITDIDGRYSLFLPPGKYELVINKANYSFPSAILRGKTEDELYANLYFGGPIEVKTEEVTALDIPLDPVGFDWNDFMKKKGKLFKFYSRRQVLSARLFNIFYGVGFSLALGALIFIPSWLNVGIFVIYLMFFAVRIAIRVRRHRGVVVKRQDTGEPISFAIIRFYLADINQEVKSVAVDELGRFFVLLRPGLYYLTVEEKRSDGSYQQIYKSDPMELRRGVLLNDILVPAAEL